MKLKTGSLWLAVFIPATMLTAFIAVPGLEKPDTVSSATTAPPTISSIAPAYGVVFTAVTINGAVFGNARGTSYALFGSVRPTSYVSWSSAKTVVKVPAGLAKGATKIKVVVSSGGTSNLVRFTVI